MENSIERVNLSDKINDLIDELGLNKMRIKRAETKSLDASYLSMLRVLNASKLAYFELDIEAGTVYASDMFFKDAGNVEGWLYHDELFKSYSHEELLKYLTVLAEVYMNQSVERDVRLEMKSKQHGGERSIKITLVPVIDEQSGHCVIIGTSQDVTTRVQDIAYVHRLLKANDFLLKVGEMVKQGIEIDELYRTILEGVLEILPNAYKGCILLLDFNNNIYIRESVGYDVDYAKEFRIPFYSSFASMVLNGDYRRSVFINNIQEKYGDLFPDVNSAKRGFVLRSNITSPINIDGKLYGLITIDSGDLNGFDDTDLNLVDFLRGKIEISLNRFKELSRVIESSTKDELTGAFNRRFYRKIVESLISDSTMNKETFSMVVFDIDDLKVVNDTLGHLAGDELLKQFTQIMRLNMREEDVFARLGGDEFVGLFRNIDKKRLAFKIEEIIKRINARNIKYDMHNLDLRFSYGISQFPVDGETETALMSVADRNMYINKKERKSYN